MIGSAPLYQRLHDTRQEVDNIEKEMADDSEYVDYESYLEGNFSPIRFANTLIQATNNPTDTDIDLDAPAKRLTYDLEEVDKLVSKIAGEEYRDLLSQASHVEIARDSLTPLRSGLDQVNYSYGKLVNDVLKPYDEAHGVHAALRRLHSTSSLLRSLTWYLYLARQLDNTEGSLYDLAVNINQCIDHLNKYPQVQTLEIVKQHESKELLPRRQKCRDQALAVLRAYTLKTDANKLKGALLAINEFDTENTSTTTLLQSSVKDILPRKIRESSEQLIKSLVALPQAFLNAAADARDRATSLVILSQALKETDLINKLEGFEDDNNNNQRILQFFWRDLASEFESKLRDYLRRNETAARGRKRLVPQLKESITNAVLDSGIENESSPAVKVMTSVFSSWERL